MKIYVKDTHTGSVHEVGSNKHDSLIIENGALYYRNLQNGEGTRCGGYVFCTSDGQSDFNNDEYDNYYHVGFSEKKYQKQYEEDIKKLHQMLLESDKESFLYGLTEKTPSEFFKKFGQTPFSTVFPNWKNTTCGKKMFDKYHFYMVVETTKALELEIIKKFNLTFIEEK